MPVLGRFASFETGVAKDLATTFRCNCNDLPSILPICQFCSDYQELSEFSYI
nr:MAG TPA: Complement C5-like protein [Bacteriophage sp.]